ncbi:hypothetical protein SDC9_71049 [bioreactor metagenome]|uniref:Uncharacterized protein n=1 Tax=bioreactor metagenome TaxID=1076179 RepID=A0A644Y7M4_9ZZZZ
MALAELKVRSCFLQAHWFMEVVGNEGNGRVDDMVVDSTRKGYELADRTLPAAKLFDILILFLDFLHQGSQGFLKLLVIDRLEQIVEHPQADRLLHVVEIGMAGKDYGMVDWAVAEHGKPVLGRKADVGDDDVGFGALDQLFTFEPIACGSHEIQPQQLPADGRDNLLTDDLLVLHEYNRIAHLSLPLSPWSSGKEIRTCVPFPGCEVMENVIFLPYLRASLL